MSEAETAEIQTPDELMPQVEELKYLWGSGTCHEWGECEAGDWQM